MNKNESKYYNTALLMDEALLQLLQNKDFGFITVKELCGKAGVNRSTFYLHYESMNDLLKESVDMINKRFYDKYSGISYRDIKNADKKESFLITPQYLSPYLSFIKENKKIFRLICEKPDLFETSETFGRMYAGIFQPILEKYAVKKESQSYVFAYYFGGLTAIIMNWIKEDCKMAEEELVSLITSLLPGSLADKDE